jgi:hypothetical protein
LCVTAMGLAGWTVRRLKTPFGVGKRMLGLWFRPFLYRSISNQRDISGSPSFRGESFLKSVYLVSISIGLTLGSRLSFDIRVAFPVTTLVRDGSPTQTTIIPLGFWCEAWRVSRGYTPGCLLTSPWDWNAEQPGSQSETRNRSRSGNERRRGLVIKFGFVCSG